MGGRNLFPGETSVYVNILHVMMCLFTVVLLNVIPLACVECSCAILFACHLVVPRVYREPWSADEVTENCALWLSEDIAWVISQCALVFSSNKHPSLLETL